MALTTPMDVIKTMLQTRGTATDPELRNVNGFMAGAKLLHSARVSLDFSRVSDLVLYQQS